jgi:voltage-gated potassium channel
MTKRFRILYLIAILIAVLFIDVTGYILIEKVSFLDALYMTIISIATVGYGEVFPLSPLGIVFTIFVIVTGLGIFLSAAVFIAEHTVEDRIRKILGRRKMKTLAKMKDHIIIVGYGRMGEVVARDLAEKNVNFIIMECNQERFAAAEERGYNVMLADATHEESLTTAEITKARTFITLLPTDAENIFTVLTARELKPDIFIITRALDVNNEKKLYKIGADLVVTPHSLASRRIINTVLKPNVVNLIDLVTQTRNLALSLEEITIAEDSPLAGKTIKDSGIRKDFDAMVVAVKRQDKMFFNPSAELEIRAGDLLILIGEREKLLRVT